MQGIVQRVSSMFHQRVPANAKGRDFVAGDLHGSLRKLEDHLAAEDFNPALDRLFLVGDLIDRGPDSMGCLELLREPWVYAVRGNHERMLIDYVDQGQASGPNKDPSAVFVQNGGGWVGGLDRLARQKLEELMPFVRCLPYVITVGDGSECFHVAHAEIMGDRFSTLCPGIDADLIKVEGVDPRIPRDEHITNETVVQMIEPLTWGRRLVSGVQRKLNILPDFLGHNLMVGDKPFHPGLSLTYVGHTILPALGLQSSHLFIDRGAYQGELLAVLQHDKVQSKLRTMFPEAP